MKYIFVIEREDGSLGAGRKEDIDSDIKNFEDSGEEIDFKVVAKLPEPKHLDFAESSIEWYEDKERTKLYVDRAILTIINFLK